MPPASPPTCPPIEMPGTANVSARLTRISTIAWPSSDPVERYSRMRSAPIRPKIAPDAPTVTANFGLNQSAPAEPARPETT